MHSHHNPLCKLVYWNERLLRVKKRSQSLKEERRGRHELHLWSIGNKVGGDLLYGQPSERRIRLSWLANHMYCIMQISLSSSAEMWGWVYRLHILHGTMGLRIATIIKNGGLNYWPTVTHYGRQRYIWWNSSQNSFFQSNIFDEFIILRPS